MGFLQNLIINLFFIFFLTFCSSTEIPPRINGLGRSGYATLDSEKVNFRLPNETKPLMYSVELTTHVHNDTHPQQFEFTGKVQIDFDVLEATNKVTIHQRQLTIKSVKLDDSEVPFSYINQTEFLIIESNRSSLQIGTNHTLLIEYLGTLRTDSHGFYRTLYDDVVSGKKKYIAATQFESTDARHAFPCYDEPGIRAPIDLIINHGTAYHALSNMPTVSVIHNNKTGYTRTHFGLTPSMPPYILAFFISDFKDIEDSKNKQRVFARPKYIKDGEGAFALDAGFKIIDELEKYVDVKYILPKMDQVAAPDFAAGAMENWGLVIYREELLLYNKEKSPMKQLAVVAEIVGHEFGHQFFGNHVSPKWWSTLWLNEGFATFCEFLSADLAYPELQIGETFLNKKLYVAFNTDAQENTRPMTSYVEDPKDIGSIFDDISYAKSGSFLRMLQHAMGDKTFRLGLKYYLEEKYLQSAVPEDLAAGLQKACDELKCIKEHTILDIINSWSLQKGYPVLMVSRDASGNVTLNQERFIMKKTQQPEEQVFTIPYSIAITGKPNFENTLPDGWLLTKQGVLSPTNTLNWTTNDWIIFNKQQTGYYRVNYDENLWNLIIKQLKDDYEVIMHMNRAQLLEDSFSLAKAGYIKYDIPLDLVGYMMKEQKYVPWTVAHKNFNSFLLLMGGFEHYPWFKKFVLGLVDPLYNNVKIQNPPNETLHTKLLRELAVPMACKVGSASCRNDSLTHLEASITKEIDNELKSMIFCNGLRTAGNETFIVIWNQMQAFSDSTERTMLIDSLGCSEDKYLLNLFLETSIENITKIVNYSEQERSRVLSSVYNNYEYGLDLAMSFLDENRKDIDRLYNVAPGRTAIGRAVRGMSKYVVKDTQRKTFKELLSSLKEEKYINEGDISSSEAVIAENYEWIDKYGEDVDKWIKVNVKGGSNALISSTIMVTLISWVILHVL